MKKTLIYALLMGSMLLTACNDRSEPKDSDEKKQNSEESDAFEDLNGHEFVDLGLLSGTLWATCNVGSLTPEGAGHRFA